MITHNMQECIFRNLSRFFWWWPAATLCIDNIWPKNTQSFVTMHNLAHNSSTQCQLLLGHKLFYVVLKITDVPHYSIDNKVVLWILF